MHYLILTIILSAFIYVIFKLFDRYQIDTFQAIVMNYFTCAIMGIAFTGWNQISAMMTIVKPAIPYAFILGLSFITVFTFIGKTSQKFGVGTASIADKLSLVIPVIFAFIFYKDEITVLKLLGIILSIIAVYFAVKKQDNPQQDVSKIWYYPVIVFFGGGIIGTILKEVQIRFPELNYNTFLIFLFGVAFLLGLFAFIFQLMKGNSNLSIKSILAGIGLGVPNYGSILFLMYTLNTPNWESSIVFPIMNIGIVVLSAIFGFAIFKEHFSKANTFGLVLSVLAISILLIETLNG